MIVAIHGNTLRRTHSIFERGIIGCPFGIHGRRRRKTVVGLPKEIDGIFPVGNGCNIKNRYAAEGIGHIEFGVGTVYIETRGSGKYRLGRCNKLVRVVCLPEHIDGVFAVADTRNIEDADMASTYCLCNVQSFRGTVVGQGTRVVHTGLRAGSGGCGEGCLTEHGSSIFTISYRGDVIRRDAVPSCLRHENKLLQGATTKCNIVRNVHAGLRGSGSRGSVRRLSE